MRKITALFFSCLIMFFAILIGDALDKSDYIPKTNDETIDKIIETTKTADDYISIAEFLTGASALVTGIIVLKTRGKQ